MGTVKINNGTEWYVSDSLMPGMMKWLETNATVAPLHFLGKHGRPICSALSSNGTVDEKQVTCGSCTEALSNPMMRARINTMRAFDPQESKRPPLTEGSRLDRKDEPLRPDVQPIKPPPKPQLPPIRVIREDEKPPGHPRDCKHRRVSARRGQ